MPHSEPSRKPDSLVTPHKPAGLRFAPPPPPSSGSTPPPPQRPHRPRKDFGFPPPRRPRRRGRGLFVLAALAAIALIGAGVYLLRPSGGGGEGVDLALEEGFELPPPRAFPDQDTLNTPDGRFVTRYTADAALQARTQIYLDRYRPEGAVVAVADLRTGQIRALAERDSGMTGSRPRLALGNSFPAASIAKIITAAAALEGGVCLPGDALPLLGGAHTLYRSQLKTPAHGRYNTVSLREAFARSINPTFGILGMQVGPESLRKMGERLGFNRVAAGSAFNVPDSGFGLAEVACGYTTTTTLTPLHALQIARAIGTDGRVLPTRFTRELQALDGGEVVKLDEPEAAPFTSPATLAGLRQLMEATVTSGTARRGFRRNLLESDFTQLEMGGKTGSLNGFNPPGRYEWFVGYARRKDQPDQGIAVAVMLINRTYLAVHATELAGLVIRDWSRYSAPFPNEDGKYLAER